MLCLVVQNDPYSKESVLLRGTTYLKMECFSEAIADFTRLLGMGGTTSIETYYKRGKTKLFSILHVHVFMRILSCHAIITVMMIKSILTSPLHLSDV
jgi:hypothetical protein